MFLAYNSVLKKFIHMSLNSHSQLVDSVHGIDAVKTTSYGVRKSRADVVLMAQHAGNSRQLVAKLNGKVVDDPGVFEDFLRIDRDACTSELAHAIAEQIARTAGDLSVRVVEVLYERGLLDPNRTAGFAVRNVLKHEGDTEIMDLMRDLHIKTAEVYNRYLRDVSVSKGLFLDLHSMAPYDPLDLEGEQPGNLVAYNDAYAARSRRGARRSLDLIVGSLDTKTMIANPCLVENVFRRLEAKDVPMKFNEPYPRPGMDISRIMSARYMMEYPGLALDFPKDFCTIDEAENSSWDIANPEPDHNKIQMYAKILGPAVVESVWDIRV